MSADADDLPNI